MKLAEVTLQAEEEGFEPPRLLHSLGFKPSPVAHRVVPPKLTEDDRP